MLSPLSSAAAIEKQNRCLMVLLPGMACPRGATGPALPQGTLAVSLAVSGAAHQLLACQACKLGHAERERERVRETELRVARVQRCLRGRDQPREIRAADPQAQISHTAHRASSGARA